MPTVYTNGIHFRFTDSSVGFYLLIHSAHHNAFRGKNMLANVGQFHSRFITLSSTIKNNTAGKITSWQNYVLPTAILNNKTTRRHVIV